MQRRKKDPANLVDAFLVSVPAASVEQAIRDMNKQLNTNYQRHDLYKWRRGDRDIPQKVQNYMMPWAIIYVSENMFGMKLDALGLQVVTKLLSPPQRREH
jgi:hypothetical protein